MAKLTLADLTSLANEASAIATINANMALIEAALENTVSIDGTVPNSMTADFDLNSNDLLNVNVGNFTDIILDGAGVPSSSDVVNAQTVAAALQGQDDIAYAATAVALDFNGHQNQVTTPVTGDITYETNGTANRAKGKSLTLILQGDGSNHTITWNSNWIQIGAVPTTLTANKTLMVSLVCIGTAETDVIISGGIQV